MAAAGQSVKFTQTIRVPANEVFRAFTHATALRDWLADAARVDARAGGPLYLYWHSGYAVMGQFVTVQPGSKLVFTWHGTGEPEPTRVKVTLRENEEGTAITLVHEGLGSGKKWADARVRIAGGWQTGLENLQSILETGIDLRFARRPRLGIIYEEVSSEVAARLSLPAPEGVLVQGTMEGSGARAAGLQQNDVLVKMGSKKIGRSDDISVAVAGHHAGDRVPATLLRGGERVRTDIELSAWPIVPVPATPAELAEESRRRYASMNAELAEFLKGVSEAEAEYRPTPEEWNIKEILAHLIACERDYQSWVADMVNDSVTGESLQNRPNVTPRLQAIVRRFPSLPELVHELECAQDETAQFLEHLPPGLVARKHLYRRVADWNAQTVPSHLVEEHGDQLRATLAAARGAASS